MTELLEEPRAAVVTEADDDLDRVRFLIADMLQGEAAQLVATMWKLRRVTNRVPPMTGAFACLALAELLIMNTDMAIADETYAYLRSLAVGLAQRIGRSNLDQRAQRT